MHTLEEQLAFQFDALVSFLGNNLMVIGIISLTGTPVSPSISGNIPPIAHRLAATTAVEVGNPQA